MPSYVPFWCLFTGGYGSVECRRNSNVWSEASDTIKYCFMRWCLCLSSFNLHLVRVLVRVSSSQKLQTTSYKPVRGGIRKTAAREYGTVPYIPARYSTAVRVRGGGGSREQYCSNYSGTRINSDRALLAVWPMSGTRTCREYKFAGCTRTVEGTRTRTRTL